MTSIACIKPAAPDLAAWIGSGIACVPLSAAFEPLTSGQRLLIARDGLYVEAASPTLYVRALLASAPTIWGEIDPVIKLRHGFIPRLLMIELGLLALESHPKEMAALIVADDNAPGGYRLHQPASSGLVGAITYDDTKYAEGNLVIDAHSHGPFSAVFSKTDDLSDQSRLDPHISIVFGQCASPDSMTLAVRLCIGSYLLPLKVEQLSELIA